MSDSNGKDVSYSDNILFRQNSKEYRVCPSDMHPVHIFCKSLNARSTGRIFKPVKMTENNTPALYQKFPDKITGICRRAGRDALP